MKAYTDIEQSKKLAEILPIESADMWYCPYPNDVDWHNEPNIGKAELLLNQLPCWSLAALLNSVKYNTINLHYNDVRNDWIASCTMEHSTRYETGRALNPIDACYEMILKLHELKLL